MADIPTPTQVTQTLPSPYLTGAFTALGERLLPLLATSAAIPTTTYAQQVAPETQLQQQARGLAGGLGGYQQYLTQAEQYSGPQAYQQFMSPYQQQVIDTTLTEFDRKRQQMLNQQQAQAVAGGAFGGAREGVQRAEFGAQSLQDRAALQAQLLQQGFGQAQQAAQTAFTTTRISCITTTINIRSNRSVKCFRSTATTTATSCVRCTSCCCKRSCIRTLH